jgi:hypothetical protein
VSGITHESGTRKLQGSQTFAGATRAFMQRNASATAPDSIPGDQRHAVHARGACEADSSATVRDLPARGTLGRGGGRNHPCALRARETGHRYASQLALLYPSGPGPTMPSGHVAAAVPVGGFNRCMLLHGHNIQPYSPGSASSYAALL